LDSEKLKVLELVQNGQISAAGGMELLKSLEDNGAKQAPQSSGRYLRIRVDSDRAKKINVNIPMGLIKIFSRFAGLGMKYLPEEARREMERKGIDLTDIHFEDMVPWIDQGLVEEKLVDIDIDDPQEGRVRVQIYVD
jgi:hypothetical protein